VARSRRGSPPRRTRSRRCVHERLNLPVLLAARPARATNQGRTPSDLRESGAHKGIRILVVLVLVGATWCLLVLKSCGESQYSPTSTNKYQVFGRQIGGFTRTRRISDSSPKGQVVDEDDDPHDQPLPGTHFILNGCPAATAMAGGMMNMLMSPTTSTRLSGASIPDTPSRATKADHCVVLSGRFA